MSRTKTLTVIADLALLGVNVIWGATFVTMKQLLGSIPFPKILLGRFLIATLCLLVFSLSKKWSKNIFCSGGILGLALFGGYFFQTWGLLYTTPARSAFITGLSALLVPIFVYFIFKKRADAYTLSGIVVALFGLVLLTLRGGESFGEKWWGDFLTALGACAYAAQIVLVEKFSQEDTFPLVTVEMATVTLLSFIFFLRSGNRDFSFSPTEWASIGFLGIIATALTFAVQKFAQKITPAVHAGLIFISEPVFAAFFSYFFWQERFTKTTVAGCIFILLGILLPQLKTLLTPDSPPLQPSGQTLNLPNREDR